MPLPIKEKYEPDSVNEIFQWLCGLGSMVVYGEVKVGAKFRKDSRKVSLVGALAWNQVIPTSCVRCTHLRRLVCGQCVNISCGNYGMLLTKRGWQLIRSRVFTKNVSPCTVCKSVVPLDNSAFDPTLRGGERVLRRWQQYWECFLTLNILNDCFKYHSSEHGLKTNKTETYSKIACNIKALSHTSNRNIPCIFGRK